MDYIGNVLVCGAGTAIEVFTENRFNVDKKGKAKGGGSRLIGYYVFPEISINEFLQNGYVIFAGQPRPALTKPVDLPEPLMAIGDINVNADLIWKIAP